MEIKKTKLFIGTGGVGKTTLASVCAINLAEEFPDKKIKLITIDPSKRLKDYFKMEAGETEKIFKNLSVSLGSREELMKEFILGSYSGDERQVKKIYENSIFKKLIGGLAVSQEFTSLYEIYKSDKEMFDYVIVDTPPLQNAGTFLSGADKLESLFSSSFVKFFVPGEGQGVIYKLFFKARRKSLDILSKLTGSDFVQELTEFFMTIERVRPHLLEVLESSKLILEERAEVICVCNHNELSLAGLCVSLRELVKKNLQVHKCYVNKYEDLKNNKSAIQSRMVKLKKENEGVDFLNVPKFEKDLSCYEDLLRMGKDVRL